MEAPVPSTAPLRVTANSASRFYGSPNPPLTGSIAGLVNGDNISATYVAAATTQSMPGNYPIKAVISDPNRRMPNYNATFIDGMLTVLPAPVITLSSASVQFDPQQLLSTSQSLVLNVGNVGTADLIIARVTLDGINAGDFTVNSGNCSTVQPFGPNCFISIKFTPAALGSRTALIRLTDNTGGYTGSQQSVSLAGNGVLSYAVYATNTGCGAFTTSGNALIDGNSAVNGNATLSGKSVVNGTIWIVNPSSNTGKGDNGGKGDKGDKDDNGDKCKDGNPSITISGNATLSGGYSKLAAPVAFTVPKTVMPGTVDLKVKTSTTLSAANKYHDITVQPRATLTLLQGVYYINSLTLGGDSKVVIAGPVILNVAGMDSDDTPLDLTGGSITTSSGKASDLVIVYGGGEEVKLSEGKSTGVIYAPNAQVRSDKEGDWYGALVVKTMEASGKSSIHYDPSLAR